jgi:magnesium-transporting ATPase (P-type)
MISCSHVELHHLFFVFHSQTYFFSVIIKYAARKATSEKNAISTKEKESLVKKFLSQFTEPLIMLLLVSAAVSVSYQH